MNAAHSDSESRYCLIAFVADTLSVLRLAVALAILWLGWTVGRQALPVVIILATLGWIGDGLDGPMARRSPCRTRLGAYDYPLDVILTWAEFIYAAQAGFIPVVLVVGYTVGALIVTLWFRRKAVLVLFMRGIDVIAIYFALRYAPLYLAPLLVWLLILGVAHRERVKSGIPHWFDELLRLFHLKRESIDRTT
jgi:phosphatidylglycerophosphate synthase